MIEAALQSSTFWVGVAFLIFVALVAKKGFAALASMLDERSARIKAELEEAQRLREEAQSMLAAYQRSQRDALKDAEEIVAHAREEAERIRHQAAADLDTAMKRREAQAMDKIAQAEQAALRDVRDAAVDAAVAAARTVLTDELATKKADALVDAAIADLPNKLH